MEQRIQWQTSQLASPLGAARPTGLTFVAVANTELAMASASTIAPLKNPFGHKVATPECTVLIMTSGLANVHQGCELRTNSATANRAQIGLAFPSLCK